MTQNEMVAQWWAVDFEIKDKREEFRSALVKYLDEHPDITNLEVDYDPNEPLIHVLKEIGIECGGSFFSADGIFHGRKTRSKRVEGKWLVKGGYGLPFIPVEDDLE